MENKNYALLFIVIAVAIVLLIGINVRDSAEGFLFDESIMQAIHSNNTVVGTKIMKGFSFLGSKYFFALIGLGAFAYFFYTMKRRYAWLAVAAIPGSYVINAILKLTFSRTRPLDYMLIEKTSYSFPSGHSMVSMSAYCMAAYILLEIFEVEDKTYRIIAWTINFIIIGLIGFSRLYLGVHWPTDVISGFLMGAVVFYLSKENIK